VAKVLFNYQYFSYVLHMLMGYYCQKIQKIFVGFDYHYSLCKVVYYYVESKFPKGTRDFSGHLSNIVY
jgi:hypothetical protein